MPYLKLIVGDAHDGMLLREFLRHEVSISRALLVRLKQDTNGILLNGKHVTVRAVLHAGDILELSIDDTECAENIVPRNLPLSILYEDESVLVVNKPGGMPTHPSHGHYEDTLANAVAYLYEQRGAPFVFRPVNRLDAGTSGIVLLAKDQHAAHLLSEQIADRLVQKQYLAIVSGFFSGEGTLETGFRRKEGSVLLREVFSSPSCDAERAATYYRSVSSGAEATLVALTPHTGRTHQLRVHCAYLGHPILGDWLYGSENVGIARPMLHAASLSFLSPSGTSVRVSVPPPDDFLGLCRTFALSLPELQSFAT